MQTVFAVVAAILAFLIYFSGRAERINQWFAVAVFLFFLGVFKQAIVTEIIPLLSTSFGLNGLDSLFAPVHSVLTWAIYTLAMPALFMTVYYFSNFDEKDRHPIYVRLLSYTLCILAAAISYFYNPLKFSEYQFYDRTFWVVFTVYNCAMGVVISFLGIKGSVVHKNMGTSTADKIKERRKMALPFLPMLWWWLITVFPVHLLRVERLFGAWQFNFFIGLACVVIFIVVAFNDGYMGLRLVIKTYRWADVSSMDLINRNAEIIRHFLKTQINNMNMSTYLLREHYAQQSNNGEIGQCLDDITKGPLSNNCII